MKKEVEKKLKEMQIKLIFKVDKNKSYSKLNTVWNRQNPTQVKRTNQTASV